MLLAVAGTAQASPVEQRVCEAMKAQKPVKIVVHVALCDNSVIVCGSKKLGDGDDLATNLYWGTHEGFSGWMKANPGPWRLVERTRDHLLPSKLERVRWARTLSPAGSFRACGTKPVEAEMLVHAWRGARIDDAVDAFVDDATRSDAHVVTYVGHNRWMDYDSFPFAEKVRATQSAKAIVAVACYSRAYLKPWIAGASHLALALTNDFVMASGAAAVGAIDAFLEGRSLTEIRRGATESYARAQRKDPRRISKVFVNESAAGW